MEKMVIQKIFARNIVLILCVAVLLAVGVNWKECFTKRGKYLLGIVYNGKFENAHDRIVYEDYLRRHGSTPQRFEQDL